MAGYLLALKANSIKDKLERIPAVPNRQQPQPLTQSLTGLGDKPLLYQTSKKEE